MHTPVRFSILSLISVTTIVAINVAGVAYPDSAWRRISGFCVAASLSWLTIENARGGRVRPAILVPVLVAGSTYLAAILHITTNEMAWTMAALALLAGAPYFHLSVLEQAHQSEKPDDSHSKESS